MSQKLSPFLGSKYGWNFGESGWNLGMDENILKFSYMATKLIDGVVDTLPSQATNGSAYFLTTDNTVYFRVENEWRSVVIPKWSSLFLKTSGEEYVFNGTSLVDVKNNAELSQELSEVSQQVGSLGTAAFEDSTAFSSFDSSPTPITKFGVVGTADDTATFQAALDSGVKSLIIPANTTVTVGTVTIPASITIVGMDSTSIIRRKDNYELDNSSAGGPTNTLIDITAHNVSVLFSRLCFDGNEQNQPVDTPSGTLIRSYNIQGSTSNTLDIRMDTCLFVNQTRSSILVKGHIESEGEEVITITNCLFLGGRPGIGSGDPRSANPSGFAPYYINVNDKFRLICSNNAFIFNKSLSSGAPLDYAPGAVRFTRVDATSNDQGSTGLIQGCYFYRCGRGDIGFDGTPNSNNGLGVVEAYTVGRDISVTGCRFVQSLSSCVRAKVSIDNLIVTGNLMRSCQETAVSIGPMLDSAGNQTGRIIVNGNTIRGADINGITIVGDSSKTPNRVGEIIITGNIVSGITNRTGSSGGNEAAITVRQAYRVIVSENLISECNTNSGVAGIRLRLCAESTANANKIDGVSSFGIYAQSTEGSISVLGNSMKNCGDSGILCSEGSNCNFTINDNNILSAVNAGISVASGKYITVNGNTMTGITGSGRGLVLPTSGVLFVSVMSNVTNATTPVILSIDGTVTQSGNSWNPTVQYRSASPTSGTWRVGDIVYNTSPAASGVIGWVCVTAGTPGSWKSFGNISA